MKELISDVILNNSKAEMKKINENDISAVFYNDLVGKIVSFGQKSFIGPSIGEVQPLKQPIGQVFAKKVGDIDFSSDDSTSFEIIEKTFPVDTNKTICKITQEAFDDLEALKKLSDTKIDILADFVEAQCGRKETKKILDLLLSECADGGSVTLADNIEESHFKLLQKINELVVKINEKQFKTYEAFCVLPQSLPAGVALGISFAYDYQMSTQEGKESDKYFLGRSGPVKFYVNPDPSVTEAIVGINSTKEHGVSSLIYCPYAINFSTVDDWRDGKRTIAIFTRNGYTINPLHDKVENPYLFKFTIG